MGKEYYKKIFSQNLKYYMNIYNKTQNDIINDLNINKSTISTWVNGTRLPRMDMVNMLAEYFHINRSDLIEDKKTEKQTNKGVKIPVLGKVIAGIPVEAIEDIIDYEEITEDMAMKGEYFGLQIKGDSMKPRIQEGDVVIVKKQEDVESGDTAIVLVNGHDATCKKIKKTDQGIMLIPGNPSYEPIFFTNEEIISLPVTIIGKVVELRGKF